MSLRINIDLIENLLIFFFPYKYEIISFQIFVGSLHLLLIRVTLPEFPFSWCLHVSELEYHKEHCRSDLYTCTLLSSIRSSLILQNFTLFIQSLLAFRVSFLSEYVPSECTQQSLMMVIRVSLPEGTFQIRA